MCCNVIKHSKGSFETERFYKGLLWWKSSFTERQVISAVKVSFHQLVGRKSDKCACGGDVNFVQG